MTAVTDHGCVKDGEQMIIESDYVAGNPEFNGSDRLIVVSGCSGGGKSALLSEMARRGYQVFPEPGRQIVKEQIYVGGDGLPWENIPRFIELCLSRATYFYNMASPGDGFAFFDRSLVDAVSACARLGLETPAPYRTLLQRYRYAKTVFLAPPWKELFQNDAERKHGFAAAVAEYEALVVGYPEYGYEVELIPQLGIEARADFLEERLQQATR